MSKARPFRFAVICPGTTTPDALRFTELARRAEGAGYSTLYVPDHFVEHPLAPMYRFGAAVEIERARSDYQLALAEAMLEDRRVLDAEATLRELLTRAESDGAVNEVRRECWSAKDGMKRQRSTTTAPSTGAGRPTPSRTADERGSSSSTCWRGATITRSWSRSCWHSRTRHRIVSRCDVTPRRRAAGLPFPVHRGVAKGLR